MSPIVEMISPLLIYSNDMKLAVSVRISGSPVRYFSTAYNSLHSPKSCWVLIWYIEINSDNLVLETAWKDNNLVSFLSTIHDFVKLDPELVRVQQATVDPGAHIGLELIVRTRKRPKATSTAARAIRADFGSAATKKLAIPHAIDEYNYCMG